MPLVRSADEMDKKPEEEKIRGEKKYRNALSNHDVINGWVSSNQFPLTKCPEAIVNSNYYEFLCEGKNGSIIRVTRAPE